MIIDVILPTTTDDYISERLRGLVRRLRSAGADTEKHMGVLGGSDGYGCPFANDTFEIRPFFWGDCDCGFEAKEEAFCAANDHTPTCTRATKHATGKLSVWTDCDCGYRPKLEAFELTHRHMPTCSVELPNFKCGAFEVRWYKYIGRGMEVRDAGLSRADVAALLDRCEASIGAMVKP